MSYNNFLYMLHIFMHLNFIINYTFYSKHLAYLMLAISRNFFNLFLNNTNTNFAFI